MKKSISSTTAAIIIAVVIVVVIVIGFLVLGKKGGETPASQTSPQEMKSGVMKAGKMKMDGGPVDSRSPNAQIK